MNKKLFTNIVRLVSVCSALLLFLAVLPNPSNYYWILRTIVSIGAIIIIFNNITKAYWVVLFAIVLVLFNPIFPIYLNKKILWMPIDIATGLLFLVEIIINRPKKAKPILIEKEVKKYERDRII